MVKILCHSESVICFLILSAVTSSPDMSPASKLGRGEEGRGREGRGGEGREGRGGGEEGREARGGEGGCEEACQSGKTVASTSNC